MSVLFAFLRDALRQVLAAMRQNGYALAHAPARLQNDRGVVLAALASTQGDALQFASTVTTTKITKRQARPAREGPKASERAKGGQGLSAPRHLLRRVWLRCF